jgi:hypothetical protein
MDLGKFRSPRGCAMEWFHLVFSWKKIGGMVLSEKRWNEMTSFVCGIIKISAAPVKKKLAAFYLYFQQ